jgi:hypothetical protein
LAVRPAVTIPLPTPPANVTVPPLEEETLLPAISEEEGAMPPGQREPEPAAEEPPAPADTTAEDPDAARSKPTGGDGVFLAAIEPTEVQDVRLDDQPLRRAVTLGQREHRQSIWAQPRLDRGTCQVSYMLDKRYARLRGAAGLADPPTGETPAAEAPTGEVPAAETPTGEAPAGETLAMTFRIYGDANLLWQSETANAPGAIQAFDVDVRGVTLVVLVSESESPSPISRGAWLDVRLTPLAEGP